jgi:hypothetical protein
MERPRAGGDLQSAPPDADLSGKPGGQGLPLQRLFRQSQIPKIDGASYRLNLSGLVDSRKPWTLDELYALPQESQVTRHVCVEGWSMIGKWTGVPFRTFLQRIGADSTAKYVGFECADGYYSSIDMASALHPQTFLTSRFPTRFWRRATAIRSSCASRPSSASRIRNGSRRCT